MSELGAPPPPDAGAVGAPPAGRSGPLPPGALLIGIALAIQGLTTYAFVVIANHALAPKPYSAFSALWALTFVAAPGLFLPLEQEVGRAASARRVAGLGAGPVVRRALLLGTGLALGVIVLSGAGEAPLISTFFNGQGLLLLGFLVAMAVYTMYYLARGTLAGSARFRGYAAVLVVEGAVRIIAALVLLRAGVTNVGAYGLAISLPCVIGIAVVLPRQRGIATPGPPARWSELSFALGWLLAGSLLAQALMNVAPLAVKALFSGGDPSAAGRVLNGLIVARIPLFFFQAIQASLMPKLSADAAAGRWDDFWLLLRRILLLVAGVIVLSVAGMGVLGPTIVHILFHNSSPLGGGDLALLALGSEGMMVALALAYASIALRGYRAATTGWAAGAVALVVALVVLPGALVRVEVAFCVGVCAACAVMAVMLRMRFLTLRAQAPRGRADGDSAPVPGAAVGSGDGRPATRS
jgi:O-antigen/teichoic acid export membrane protein